MKRRVAPEFLNRIDEIVMFLPLTRDEIGQIVTLQLSSLKKKLSARDIQIDFNQGVVDFLTEKSYIPEFGARPVKRAIDDNIINPLSLELLSGNIDKTKPIKVIGDNQELRFEN